MIHRGYQEGLTTICLEIFRKLWTNMEFFPVSCCLHQSLLLYYCSAIIRQNGTKSTISIAVSISGICSLKDKNKKGGVSGWGHVKAKKNSNYYCCTFFWFRRSFRSHPHTNTGISLVLNNFCCLCFILPWSDAFSTFYLFWDPKMCLFDHF